VALDKRFEYPYTGFGSALTILSEDTLGLAGLEVKDQAFHEAVYQGSNVIFWAARDGFEAILGLAPNTASSTANITNPFQNMISQGLLDDNIFALALGRGDHMTTSPIGGSLTFGGIDIDLLDETTMQYIPLANATDRRAPYNGPILNGTWQVAMNGISFVNNESQPETWDMTGLTARIDTAFPFMSLPRNFSQRLWDMYQPHDPEWFLPPYVECQRRKELPDLTFTLGSKNFTITPYQYTLEMEWDGEVRCAYTLGAWGTAEEDDTVVLGAAFLRAWYAVFDPEGGKLGLGKPRYWD